MASITYNDLSGTLTPITSNPYDGLLQACNNDPLQIQSRYTTHRTTRNAQQKDKILSEDFKGWILDPNLTQLTGPLSNPTFTDPRHCLVFWARPPLPLRTLINTVQQALLSIAPGLWLMPLPNLHMTALEVTHSQTASQISTLVSNLKDTHKSIADYASTPGHATRLIKPMISYDAAALALSLVPAAGEYPTPPRTTSDDKYTYHHLRRALYEMTNQVVPVASRYVVPSAHLTIARFNTANPFVEPTHADATNGVSGIDMAKRELLIRKIDEINAWLEQEYWPKSQGEQDGIPTGGEWIVGEERGLDYRSGQLWYGGGETVYLGRAIEN